MAITPFPIQPTYTAIAIAYKNAKLIADSVLPRIPIGTQEFRYLKHALAESFTLPDTKVGRKGQPTRIDFSAIEVADKTEDFGLEDAVPQSDIETAPDNFDPLGRATEGLTDLILLNREKRAADLVFTLGNYPTTNRRTLSGTSQWSDFTNSQPISDILDALDSVVVRPNVLVLGQATWNKLSQHPKIVEAVFGTGAKTGIVKREAVADLFELDEILVGQGWVNTAKKGQAASLARVWGKHALLFNRNNLADNNRGVTFGYTAEFGNRIAGAYEDKNVGLRGGQVIRVGESVKELIAANDLAYFFQNAVA